MGEGFEKVKGIVKSVAKKSIKPFIIIAAIVVAIVIIAAPYIIKKEDASHKENDWKNTPYAAEQYSSDITISPEGEITSNMTAQELWDKMLENDSRVNEYLDKPEELLKLMNAENVTKFLDTRQNPDETIDWETLNKAITENKIQGIIKLKRADSSGNTSTMTYISPEELQKLIDEYNKSGSEEAKQEALKHFTIQKGASSGSSLTGGAGGVISSSNGITVNKIREVTSLRNNPQIGDYIIIPPNTEENKAKNGGHDRDRYLYENKSETDGLAQSSYDRREQINQMASSNQYGMKVVSTYPNVYMVATSQKFGDNGDVVAFELSNGSIILTCQGDDKGTGGDGAGQARTDEWGHYYGASVVEFFEGEGFSNSKFIEMLKNEFGISNDEKSGVNVVSATYLGNILDGTYTEANTKINTSTETTTTTTTNTSTTSTYQSSGTQIMDVTTSVSDAIVKATETTPSPAAGQCQRWVRTVYANAGLGDVYYTTAFAAYEACKVSEDKTNIPVGATIYGTGSGSGAGHVGIYVGNGKVKDSVNGKINTSTLEDWIAWQVKKGGVYKGKTGWLGWGWQTENAKTKANSGQTQTQVGTKQFTTYPDLTEAQLKAIATVCQAEQGSPKGAAAEASLMANHMDLRHGSAAKFPNTGEGLYNYVKLPVGNGGWFGGASSYMDTYIAHGEPLKDDVLNAVRAVLVEGKRTLPGYINEHDCFPDFSVVGGRDTGLSKYAGSSKEMFNLRAKNCPSWVKDRSIYVKDTTIIQNVYGDKGYGSTYTFYCFPTETSDPFGYTESAAKLKSQIGDYCYDFDTGIGSGSTGSGSELSNTSMSSYYAVVATWSESSNGLTSSDPEVSGYESKTTYTMSTQTIDYQNAVKAYQMPFDYLWALTVIGGNKDFTLELADLVENSELEITVHDNLTVTTTVDTQNYTKKTKIETKDIELEIEVETDFSTSNTSVGPFYGGIDEKDEGPYTVTKTTITKTNTLDIAVTKANVWIVDYEQEFTFEGGNIEENSSNMDISTDYPDEPDETNDRDELGIAKKKKNQIQEIYENALPEWDIDVDIIDLTSEYYYKQEGSQTINTTIETSKYVSSPATTTEKTDKKSDEPNFVSILSKNEYTNTKNNILSAAKWLFEILEENKNTADMVDLTKYLIYKISGTVYDGIKEFDFENKFKPGSFTTVSAVYGGSDLLKEYIRYFENASGPPKNADGTCYIIEDDGAGHETVGYGIDIFNGGFEELFKQAGYPTSMGGEVPIEFVDALEDQEIQSCLEKIKSMTSGLNLKEYQIHALVSRSYNCGTGSLSSSGKNAGAVGIRNGKNFVEAYNAYWNEATDNLYESGATEGNFNHSLYTQYMNKPDTSGGEYLRGLEVRRKSEWTLFQTGYYDTIGKRYSEISLGNVPADVQTYNFNIYKGYIEYDQNVYANSPVKYTAAVNSRPLGYTGCCPVSIAIIMSGLGIKDANGYAYTPETLITSGVKSATNGSSYNTAQIAFNNVGLTMGPYTNTAGHSQNMLEELKNGHPLFAHINENGKAKIFSATGAHYITILDAEGTRVYVSNANKHRKTGWVEISELLNSCDWYAAVYK